MLFLTSGTLASAFFASLSSAAASFNNHHSNIENVSATAKSLDFFGQLRVSDPV